MDRQDELLQGEDGRYFAIDSLGTGLRTIATGEYLGKRVVNFGLPSGPGLFLHLAHKAFLSVRDVDPQTLFHAHPQGCWPDSQGPLFDYLENCMAHVVFAFTALEAFANEALPDSVTYDVERGGVAKVLAKSEIERQLNLDEKLGKVLPEALGIPSPKGKKVWEKYRGLKKIRDRLVHLKSVDRRASGPDDETIWGTLLKAHGQAWCDHAHAVIGYFEPAIRDRRWYRLYPFE